MRSSRSETWKPLSGRARLYLGRCALSPRAAAGRWRSRRSIGLPAGLRRRKRSANSIPAEWPDETHTIHLGLIAFGDAIEQLRHAVELALAVPPFRTNLGEICRLAGRADEAVRTRAARLSSIRKIPARSTISASHSSGGANIRKCPAATSAPSCSPPNSPMRTAIVATFCTPCGAYTTRRPLVAVRSSLTRAGSGPGTISAPRCAISSGRRRRRRLQPGARRSAERSRRARQSGARAQGPGATAQRLNQIPDRRCGIRWA